jgi:hypothetical protein
MDEGIKHMKEPREYKYELINRRDGWSGKFESMRAAFDKAELRGLRSWQLFELNADGSRRVLRFEAST